MGCCESSSDNGISMLFNGNTSSSLTSAETVIFKEIINKIPPRFRQTIINLPARQFFNVYQHHLIANFHLRQLQFSLAMVCEVEAIKGLETLLPEHKDHIIFVDMYNTLSTCLLKVNATQAAIEASKTALFILLKHTPTDSTAISMQYFYLSNCCIAVQAYKEAWQGLSKAIGIARNANEPNFENIQFLEATLHLLTQEILIRFLDRLSEPNPDEDQQEISRQPTTESIRVTPECGTDPTAC